MFSLFIKDSVQNINSCTEFFYDYNHLGFMTVII